MSEDLRQIRTGTDLHTNVAEDDCETLASQVVSVGNTMASLQKDMLKTFSSSTPELLMQNVDDATLDRYVCPKLFAGHSREERVQFLGGVYNILSRLHPEEGVKVYLNTGNAYGAAAGGNGGPTARSLNGHCYCGVDVNVVVMPAYQNEMAMHVGAPMTMGAGREKRRTKTKTFRSLVEATKWVNARFSTKEKKPDVQVLQMANQVSNMLKEVTKISSMDPTMDVGANLLQIYQGMFFQFRACCSSFYLGLHAEHISHQNG